MTVGIIGLGLIGGSMAKSAKDRTGHTVYGLDRESEIMTLARMSGAIDGTLNEHNLPWCDLILLAIRPADAVKWVEENRSSEVVAGVRNGCRTPDQWLRSSRLIPSLALWPLVNQRSLLIHSPTVLSAS